MEMGHLYGVDHRPFNRPRFDDPKKTLTVAQRRVKQEAIRQGTIRRMREDLQEAMQLGISVSELRGI